MQFQLGSSKLDFGPMNGDNDGRWWPSPNDWYQCPIFSYVSGFRPKLEECCGAGDDTGMNDLRLRCTDPNEEWALR